MGSIFQANVYNNRKVLLEPLSTFVAYISKIGIVLARLNFFAGEVHNLSSLCRFGDTKLVANYSTLTLDVHGVLAIERLQVIYSYAIRTVGRGPRGHIVGNIIDLHAPFVLSIFPTYFEMKLEKFTLENPRDVIVEVTGFGPFDPWASGIAHKFISFYEQVLLAHLESVLRDETSRAVASVHPKELVSWGVLNAPKYPSF